MRAMISADMEGATGVTYPLDVEPRGDEWHRFRKLFTADANAVALGLLEAGIEDVVINEAHASMRNILLEELDDRVRLLTGRHKPLGMMQGIEGADAVVFLGYHAGAGEKGVLSHTYLGNSILGVWLDGEPASEGYLNAALAEEHGVPVIMVTGDDKACEDALRYAPEAEHVAVKEYVSRYTAICLPPATTFRLQREAAGRAATRAGRTEALARPHRIEVEFDAVQLADATANIPTVEQTGDRRVAFDAPTMTDAMKAFKIVSSIAAAAREVFYD
ncbi:M55 family metallopeptidase [Microbacterium esteraromaticum]|uniref:M55 family metallopeptidase n=1 Tax=Microbacterium esteraromaticum TaxID=57043 RepID=A0A7D7WD45_9MICO|nr:M55 family metallopeptidase [Microbacterium esteraromaticum]QMU97177.1 M55 family metallopeptidase [Microbacterium esteraromaticum]